MPAFNVETIETFKFPNDTVDSVKYYFTNINIQNILIYQCLLVKFQTNMVLHVQMFVELLKLKKWKQQH